LQAANYTPATLRFVVRLALGCTSRHRVGPSSKPASMGATVEASSGRRGGNFRGVGACRGKVGRRAPVSGCLWRTGPSPAAAPLLGRGGPRPQPPPLGTDAKGSTLRVNEGGLGGHLPPQRDHRTGVAPIAAGVVGRGHAASASHGTGGRGRPRETRRPGFRQVINLRSFPLASLLPPCFVQRNTTRSTRRIGGTNPKRT